MGTSFTNFRGYGFWAKDDALEVWLMLVAQEIGEMSKPPNWLTAFQEDLHFVATWGATGCIVTDLDSVLINLERKNLVLQICHSSLLKLHQKGDILDKKYLNSLRTGGENSSYLDNVKTSCFIIVGEKFIELLEGELQLSSSTSPIFSC